MLGHTHTDTHLTLILLLLPLPTQSNVVHGPTWPQSCLDGECSVWCVFSKKNAAILILNFVHNVCWFLLWVWCAWCVLIFCFVIPYITPTIVILARKSGWEQLSEKLCYKRSDRRYLTSFCLLQHLSLGHKGIVLFISKPFINACLTVIFHPKLWKKRNSPNHEIN